MSTNVSEEHAASIFKVEEWAKQETSMKQIDFLTMSPTFKRDYHVLYYTSP
jgi:hypothetical protein